MPEPISIELDDEDLERLDHWRNEEQPADDRPTAAAALVFIGLDEVEGNNNHAGAEVTESIAHGIAMSLALAAEARQQGSPDLERRADRFHETFQEIGVLLGADYRDLVNSVGERLDALNEAPDEKH